MMRRGDIDCKISLLITRRKSLLYILWCNCHHRMIIEGREADKGREQECCMIWRNWREWTDSGQDTEAWHYMYCTYMKGSTQWKRNKTNSHLEMLPSSKRHNLLFIPVILLVQMHRPLLFVLLLSHLHCCLLLGNHLLLYDRTSIQVRSPSYCDRRHLYSWHYRLVVVLYTRE